jgi:hypothetical protein
MSQHDITPIELLEPEQGDDAGATLDDFLQLMASIVERHLHEKQTNVLQSDQASAA